MKEPGFTQVVQIGMVVEDAEATARRYQDVLGVDGWWINEVDTTRSLGTGFRFRDRPTPTKAKIVWAKLGSIELELIEPQDETSVYAEFLRERGPGVHHVMFATSDFGAADRHLTEHQFAVLAEGSLQGGRFRLYDAQPELGLIIEIAEGQALTPDRGL